MITLASSLHPRTFKHNKRAPVRAYLILSNLLIQTSNLLVDSNMTVKVCDFGLSQIKLRGVNLKDGQEGAKGVC